VLNDGIVASRNRVATALDQFANFKCELPHLSRQLDARGESHCINAPSRLRARRSLVHSPANAALVSFISDGTFSSVTNCTGGSPGCSITDSGNVLRMSGASNQNQPSTLTITDITRTNISTNKNDYVIGKITWVNLATYNTDQNFYTFSLHFTSPGDSLDSQLLNPNIQQTTNPSLTTCSASARQRSTTLNGVEVSDIHFVVYGDGSYDGNKWTNPENGTSTLKIVADFKDVIAAPRSRNRRPGP
jgi:hypothetical protein